MQQVDLTPLLIVLAKHYDLPDGNHVIARLVTDEVDRVSAFSPAVKSASKEFTTVGQALDMLVKYSPQENVQALLHELVTSAAQILVKDPHVDAATARTLREYFASIK